METEIKTENQTVVESAPVRVVVCSNGTVYASFNLMELKGADSLRIAARTLTHAAVLLESQNLNSHIKIESNENH